MALKIFIYFWLYWVFIAAHGLLLVVVHRLLTVVASLGAQALGVWTSVAVAHWLSCPVACGIIPDQGLNLCPLHWQADSQALDYQEVPLKFLEAWPSHEASGH